MKRIKKKVVWITGGGTGIGKELAKRFSDKNFQVVVSGRRIEKLREIQNYNRNNILPIQLDVSNYKRCNSVANIILKKFGFIDILILNAAAYSPGSLINLDPVETKKIVEINILGPINCYSPLLNIMKKKKKDI